MRLRYSGLSPHQESKLRERLKLVSGRINKVDDRYWLYMSQTFSLNESTRLKEMLEINRLLKFSKIHIYPLRQFHYLEARHQFERNKSFRFFPRLVFGSSLSLLSSEPVNYESMESSLSEALLHYPTLNQIRQLESANLKPLNLQNKLKFYYNLNSSNSKVQARKFKNLVNGTVFVDKNSPVLAYFPEDVYPTLLFVLQFAQVYYLQNKSVPAKTSYLASLMEKILSYLQAVHLFFINFLFYGYKKRIHIQPSPEKLQNFNFSGHWDFFFNLFGVSPIQSSYTFSKYVNSYALSLNSSRSQSSSINFWNLLSYVSVFLFSLISEILSLLFYGCYLLIAKLVNGFKKILLISKIDNYLTARFFVQCSWFFVLVKNFFYWDLKNFIFPVLKPVFKLNFLNLFLWTTFLKPLELKIRVFVILAYLFIKYFFICIVSLGYIILDFLKPLAKFNFYYYSYDLNNPWQSLLLICKSTTYSLGVLFYPLNLLKSSVSEIVLIGFKALYAMVFFVYYQVVLFYRILWSIFSELLLKILNEIYLVILVFASKFAFVYNSYHNMLDVKKAQLHEFIPMILPYLRKSLYQSFLYFKDNYFKRWVLMFNSGIVHPKSLNLFGHANSIVIDVYNSLIITSLVKRIVLLNFKQLILKLMLVLNPFFVIRLFLVLPYWLLFSSNFFLFGFSVFLFLISPTVFVSYFLAILIPFRFFLYQFGINNIYSNFFRIKLDLLKLDSFVGSNLLFFSSFINRLHFKFVRRFVNFFSSFIK